jgi:ABC-type cobalamin/Fe3+-siderophores transport system ATPase subunit
LKLLLDEMYTAAVAEQLRQRDHDGLSMGQRQRVRLAMTFIKEPDLVLLDEPRNSLDLRRQIPDRCAITEVLV